MDSPSSVLCSSSPSNSSLTKKKLCSSPSSSNSSCSMINKGLVMSPSKAGLSLMNSINKHKRAGSTGTTGDESYNTTDDDDDEEEEEDNDEPDCSIKEHVTSKLFDLNINTSLNLSNEFGGSFSNISTISTISTIADKVPVQQQQATILLPHQQVNEHQQQQKQGQGQGQQQHHRNSHHSSAADSQSNSSVYSDLGLDKDLLLLEAGHEQEQQENHDEDSSSSFESLRQQLNLVKSELRLKDEECERLGRIKHDMQSELEDLTASLFEEAHNMVREANEKQAAAEKALKESQMKVDVLTAEVSALKTLVLTSTPSRPNPHLHPQISTNPNESTSTNKQKKHRRSPSHFNLKYGRENSPPDENKRGEDELEYIHQLNLNQTANCSNSNKSDEENNKSNKEELEVDPTVHEEFLIWRQNPTLQTSNAFIKRLYEEDINLCLTFNNKELTEKVKDGLETGSIFIEAINDKSNKFPKKCSLLGVQRICSYRMKIGCEETWHCISQICRNRIIAVCDFFNYLKYIERGLVKSSGHEIYWEIVRLRKNIVLARLGLQITS